MIIHYRPFRAFLSSSYNITLSSSVSLYYSLCIHVHNTSIFQSSSLSIFFSFCHSLYIYLSVPLCLPISHFLHVILNNLYSSFYLSLSLYLFPKNVLILIPKPYKRIVFFLRIKSSNHFTLTPVLTLIVLG